MIGPTPGEQYLAFIDLPEDHYPAVGDLRAELDDAIMTAAELVIAERKRRDPLLRALLADGAVLSTWARYPAGQLPAGTEIRVTNSYGVWLGRTTGPQTRTRYGLRQLLRITWTTYADTRAGTEPDVEPATEVDAWVPVPCDLSAVLAAIDGYPKPTPARRSVTGGAIRLTPPMIELLTDIATHEEFYIRLWSKWDRTAQALVSREFAYVPKGNHGGQYPLRITDAGRAEAIRRGIVRGLASAA